VSGSSQAAEPNTLAVRIDFDQRAELMAAEPDVYYVTDHYLNYPTVLVRLSRIAEDPPEINIRFFPTGHWLIGMGHDRATSVQSAIGDAVFQITGKRFRDLPYSKHDLTWS
jgi:CO/xanthine dehydrogenase Mo-binding subunit